MIIVRIGQEIGLPGDFKTGLLCRCNHKIYVDTVEGGIVGTRVAVVINETERAARLEDRKNILQRLDAILCLVVVEIVEVEGGNRGVDGAFNDARVRDIGVNALYIGQTVSCEAF